MFIFQNQISALAQIHRVEMSDFYCDLILNLPLLLKGREEHSMPCLLNRMPSLIHLLVWSACKFHNYRWLE